MTPPLLEADRAWFAALNAARRARTPRIWPRSSSRSRATSADRPKLVISFGEAHLALPRSCTGRDRAFSGTNHEAVTIRAAPRGGPRPQAGKAISAAGAPGFSPHQVAHHNDNPSPGSQAERHRGPADDRGMPVDQLYGSPPEQVPTGTFLDSMPERAEHRKRHVTFSTAYPRLPQGGLATSGIRCSGAKDRLRSNGVP